jgi:nucleoside-diphosphate kinase
MSEQTLSLIKPDAVERNLIGKIIQIFEDNGLVVQKLKKIHVDLDFAKKFYSVHSERPFFNDLCSYISSGPLVAMVLKGENAVQKTEI